MKCSTNPAPDAHPDGGRAAGNPAPQDEFLARALKSREDSRRTGIYFNAADVHAALEEKLRSKRAFEKPGRRNDP